MKRLLILFLYSSALFAADTADHFLSLDYQVVNKIEISPPEVSIKLYYQNRRFVGRSEQEAQMGIVSNDGKEKKVLVEYVKNFDSDVDLQLAICCEGTRLLKKTGFVETKKTGVSTLIENTHAFCNEAKIPLSYQVSGPNKISPGNYQCIIKYTLLDY